MSGDDQLSAMFGVWEGDEELSATAWTDAGKAGGQFQSRLVLTAD